MNAFSSSIVQKTRNIAGASSTSPNRRDKIIVVEDLAI